MRFDMAEAVICCIPGCNNMVLNKTRGWCSKHYQRWQHTGDPLKSRIDREQTGKPCKVVGCGRKSGFKGYCAFHGDRIRRTGDPLVASLDPNYRPIREWIEENKAYAGDGCLIWPFYRGPNGRGVVSRDGRSTSAPNAMCRAAHGAPPGDQYEAAHSCGKGHEGCVSPQHLRWATAKETRRTR